MLNRMDMVKCIWIKFNRKEKLVIEISILHYSAIYIHQIVRMEVLIRNYLLAIEELLKLLKKRMIKLLMFFLFYLILILINM